MMQPDMQETVPAEQAKRTLFDQVAGNVTTALGERASYERNALAFYIDRTWQPRMGPHDVLTAMGVQPQASQPDMAYAIRTAISGEYEAALNKKVAESSGDISRVRALQEMRGALADGNARAAEAHQQGKVVSLGSVPVDFVPAWVREAPQQ